MCGTPLARELTTTVTRNSLLEAESNRQLTPLDARVPIDTIEEDLPPTSRAPGRCTAHLVWGDAQTPAFVGGWPVPFDPTQ